MKKVFVLVMNTHYKNDSFIVLAFDCNVLIFGIMFLFLLSSVLLKKYVLINCRSIKRLNAL